MGALDNFLRRFGYAKLDRYGLMLTGDDRVLSTRPAVLDDGVGGKIVGWLDGDLAAMELDHVGAPKKTQPKPVVAPASLHKLAPAPPPMPLAAKVIAPTAKLPGLPPEAPKVVAVPPKVADEPPVEEDEWEWDIMMAKARAAADEVQQAAAMIATAATKPAARSLPTRVAPMSDRKTVIPVPSMPAALRPSDVRPAPYTPSQPRRMPRGTAPIGEDTVRTMAAPVNDDRTSPYVTLPNEVRPVGYAHTKRVAAKQR